MLKEEEVLKSKLEKLNEEIFDFVAEYKKQYEEDQFLFLNHDISIIL